MNFSRKGTQKTRQSLLDIAAEVFAERGYRDATIAEICERAGANIAAVNYHFGDKETLYREAWRHAFQESLKAYPPDGGIPECAPAEERLRGRIEALIRRVSGEDNREFLIVHKELVNPTGLLKEVMDEEIRPLQEKMKSMIRELLGPGASEQEVLFCMVSIISQCINPMVIKRLRRKEADIGPPEIQDIEAYSNHVVKFSLAGIRAIQKEIVKGRESKKKK